VTNAVAANRVVELFDLVGVHFTAHEGLAGTTAAARHQHFFETGLARAVVTLFLALMTSALEELAADLMAGHDWIQTRMANRSFEAGERGLAARTGRAERWLECTRLARSCVTHFLTGVIAAVQLSRAYVLAREVARSTLRVIDELL
jgi:hypothetical protein